MSSEIKFLSSSRNIRSIIFFVVVLFCFLISFPLLSKGADPKLAEEGITISPPLVDTTLNPGEEITYKIQVTNPTKNLIELYPTAMDFEASGDGGEPEFISSNDDSNPYSLAKWVSFYEPKIALLPEQVVDFRYQIKVPSDAEPGGHYGVVFLSTKPLEADSKVSQISLSSRIGTLLLIRINGEIKEKAGVEEFSAPWFYFSPPVTFTSFIRNSGNVHFKPEGEVTIRDWRGKNVERLNFNPPKGNVLPDSKRKFEIKWAPETSPFWKIPVGRFSANLRLVYGQNQQTLDSKIYFWIIPWWLIITAAVMFFITLIIIIILIRKKRKNIPDSNVLYSNKQSNINITDRISEKEFHSTQNRINREFENTNETFSDRNVPQKNKRTMRF